MKKRALIFLLIPALAIPAVAQITVTWVFDASQALPDNAQYADIRTVTNSGLATITDVNVGLVMEGEGAATMRLGDYFVSLTHGTASDEERVAVLINRPQMSDTAPFGSSLGSVDITFDDSGTANNVFNIASSTGTYKADGRLSVNPYEEPVAYSENDVTNGLSALNGAVVSDKWSLLVADTQQGAVGKLVGWTLKTQGTSAESGSVDPGPGGTIADAPGGMAADRDLKSILVVAGSGAARVTANVTENLILSGGLSGAGELFKIGNGVLTLSGNSSGLGGTPNFTGKVIVTDGELEIASGMALGLSGSLSFAGADLTLRMSTSSAFSRDISLSAGTEIFLDGSGTLAGTISGDGGLNKQGTGKVTLSGVNSFLGDSTVSAGILEVAGSLTSPVNVGVNGTLVGDGLIDGVVNVSGQLLAGSNLGNLSTGNLNFTSGSTFAYEIDFASTARGLIEVAGNLGINAGAILALSETPGNFVPEGSKFTLIRYSGVWDESLFTYAGNELADGSVFNLNGMQWLIDYADGAEGLTVMAIPEPSVVVVISLTCFGFLIRRRR